MQSNCNCRVLRHGFSRQELDTFPRCLPEHLDRGEGICQGQCGSPFLSRPQYTLVPLESYYPQAAKEGSTEGSKVRSLESYCRLEFVAGGVCLNSKTLISAQNKYSQHPERRLLGALHSGLAGRSLSTASEFDQFDAFSSSSSYHQSEICA